ncbi:MAG TPA: glycosyltransferase [Candidatus Paceibacterota bacterium]|nr:glycosyltransferase [Candidatus Paceibacterota bacterium]
MSSTAQSTPLVIDRSQYSYYDRDLEKLCAFIVPQGASVLRMNRETGGVFPSGRYEYVVMADVIGSSPDVNTLFDRTRQLLSDDGRIVLTFRNRLWRPLFFAVATARRKTSARSQNWFSASDVRNMLHLSDFEVVRSGRRLLCPVYIPLVSAALNAFGQLPLVNLLCVTHFIIARPIRHRRDEYSVSVVVPARNEEGNIRAIVERMPVFGTAQELIFVEGNSNDGTWRAIQDAVAHYSGPITVKGVQQDGRGKADAVRKGFAMARGDVVMILDADITVAPEDLPKFYEAIAQGKADFVNGSRLVYPMEKRAMRPLNMLGNMFFAALLSWLIDQRLTDALCGTKALRKKDFEAIEKNRAFFGDFDAFGDFDLLLGAAKQNLKLCDLPIRYRARSYGTTNIRRFSHGWQLLKMCAFAARKMKFY